VLIQEFAKQTGLTAKTIRYYESIGLIPPPQRAENNYREYTSADVERVRFIASVRSLDFSLNDVAEFLAARDEGSLLCQQVLDSLDQHLTEIDRRIAALLALRETLVYIRDKGKTLPQNHRCDEQCLCYLITTDPIMVKLLLTLTSKIPWRKIRISLIWGLACLTSPALTPLIVPRCFEAILLTETPTAVWLTNNAGWVYGGLTGVSLFSLG
jgi:DNA-binding transcriptional MerR regulator